LIKLVQLKNYAYRSSLFCFILICVLIRRKSRICRGCSKNPNCHYVAGEESHVFLFKSKNQKRSFGLTPQDDGQDKFTKILEHSLEFAWLCWF
jgi:hypothetical protein